MSADEKQCGGTHYKEMAIQPWEVIEANHMDFWDGSAISYLMRWRAKGGVSDLEKCIHYIEKQIEIQKGKQ